VLLNKVVHFCVCAGLAMFVASQLGGALNASEDECLVTATMTTYSNAEYIEETGDVVGYELAIQHGKDSSVYAQLFDYEGVPNEDGIPLSGHIADGKLTMEGDWVAHLIEQPSNKEIIQTTHVTVNGTLGSAWFRGTIKFAALATPTDVKLKRVSHIWTCGTQRHGKPD